MVRDRCSDSPTGIKKGAMGMPHSIYKNARTVACGLAPVLLIVVALCGHAAHAVEVERDLTLGLGYRNAELNWNIAGALDGTSPNVLSELKWYEMQMVEVNAAAELRVGKHVLARGRAGYQFWWYDSSVGRYARIVPQVGYAGRGRGGGGAGGRRARPRSGGAAGE